MTVIKNEFTLDDLRNLANNDGATLKGGKSIKYKTGYQVATDGVACKDIFEAYAAIRNYKGNCGIWLENGIYYIDKSHRVSTKTQAIAEGKQYNQISVLKWADMSLLYM